MAFLNHWDFLRKNTHCSSAGLMVQAWSCTKTDIQPSDENWPVPEHRSTTTHQANICLHCWRAHATGQRLLTNSQAERYPRELILSQEEKKLQIFKVFTRRFTFCTQQSQKPSSTQQESKANPTNDLKTSVGLPKNTVEIGLPIIKRSKTGQEKGK